MLRTRWALIACAAILAGCGGGSGSDPVADALAKSEKAGSAKVALTASYVVLLGNTTYTLTGRGAFDADGGAMTYDVGDFLNLAPTLLGSARTMKAVHVETQQGPILYSSYPFITGRLPAGKRWMKLDLRRALVAVPYPTLLAVGNTLVSPGDLLDLLRTSNSVTTLGTDHYATTINLDAIQKLALGPQEMAQIMTSQGALTDGRTEVWTSKDGYVSKLQVEYDTSTVDQIQSELTVTLELSDWGAPVKVAPPPPADVADDTQAALDNVPFQRG